MEEIQSRLGERGRWFQVGVVSATLLPPLVSRWQSLRAAERARALWEASRSDQRWPWAAKREADLPRLAQRTNVSTGLWLAGVGVGLVMAGTVAYVLVRRRMETAEGEPLELPLASANGQRHGFAGQARDLVARTTRQSRVSGNATPADPPTGQAGPRDPAAAAGAGDAEAPEPLQPEAGAHGAPLIPDERAEERMAETGASYLLEDGAPAGVVRPDRAPFIGDIRTLVYHDADDEDLPAEENRVYFASREEAESAGYRADRAEAPQSGSTTPS
jgi:hypothetical protein